FLQESGHSGGMKFGRKACYFFHSDVLLFQRNSRIPELRPECSVECTGTESSCLAGVVCLLHTCYQTNKYLFGNGCHYPHHHHHPSSPPPAFIDVATPRHRCHSHQPRPTNGTETPQHRHATTTSRLHTATTQDDHATQSMMTQTTTIHSNDPLHKRRASIS
ncbi:hypothetical protein K443DRAFT_93219, partial [Laccaria amethystina LaAM-08-1]